MGINYFIGWSLEDLKVELRAAQEELLNGKAASAARAGDASIENEIVKSAEERIRMIYQALYALAPSEYPLDQITAITSTKAAFS